MPSPSSNLNSKFIRAGAGAGKTTNLVSSFLGFVGEFKNNNKKYPRVVITTFTRKATQELKERLMVKALEDGNRETFEYINKKSYVHISTIHGLLSLYLSQYAEKLKLPQDIRIISTGQYQKILKKQINDLFKKKPEYIELLETLSFNELVDVSIRLYDFRAQYTNSVYVGKHQLLKIRSEKIKSIVAELEAILNSPHSVLPANWQSYFQYLSDLKKCLVDDRIENYLELLEEKPRKPVLGKKDPPFDNSVDEAIKNLWKGKLSDGFCTLSYIDKHEQINALFFKFTEDLTTLMKNHKKMSGELTIADLENISLELIEKYPETAQDFSDSWDYFMIDEYQDTSPVQVKILNSIVREKPSFVVGDPQQSIYLFRGARSEVFEDKHREMASKNAQIDFLKKNYRSNPTLMNFVNEFFSGFGSHFEPMVPNDKKKESSNLDHDVFYIEGEDQSICVLKHIRYLIEKGVRPQDICVLGARHKPLTEIAEISARYGVSVQLQSSADFEMKREILDLTAFNRFLYNPHDNENLVLLLRSPWFYMQDQEIFSLAAAAKENKKSLWRNLCTLSHPIKEKLQLYSNLYDMMGTLHCTKQFIQDSSFLEYSEFYDHTGKREANIFKYLAALAEAEKSNGFLLGQFLNENFQNLTDDLGKGGAEAQPVQQPDCVSLMTVHAAKGLEFKHVIVVGFSDNPVNNTDKKIILNEADGQFSLSVVDGEDDKLTESDWSASVMNKFKEREAAESKRVLYVAMTRAIESLALVNELKSKAPSKSSWYAQIAWPAVGNLQRDSYRAVSLKYDENIEQIEREKNKPTAVRNKFLNASAETLKNQSVTEVIESISKSSGDSDFEFGLNNLKKAQRGSDMHRLFESLKYRSIEELTPLLDEAAKESLDYLSTQQVLDIKKIISNGHNEWGFGLRVKNSYRQGQIDLWAEMDDEIHIIDFKTGSAKNFEKAKFQLQIYAASLFAMKQISESKKIVLSAVYPSEKIVKQEKYLNFSDFQSKIDEKVRALF